MTLSVLPSRAISMNPGAMSVAALSAQENGAPEFFGPLVEEQMNRLSTGVERAEVFEECGHSLALEAPERLAAMLHEFMLGRV